MIPYNQIGTIKCYIKQVHNGFYDDNQKILHTQLGKARRVRIFGVLVDKKELITNPNVDAESSTDDFTPSNSRIEFTVDDGTGVIKAISWNKSLEDFKSIQLGKYVDLIGFVRKWRETISLNLINIIAIENLDKLLLRDAEIIEKVKKGELYEVPKPSDEFEGAIDDLSDDMVVDTLFEDVNQGTDENLKQKIYEYIEESTDTSGVHFEDLKSYFNVSEQDLEQFLRKLEMESKIYQSEENFYQAY